MSRLLIAGRILIAGSLLALAACAAAPAGDQDSAKPQPAAQDASAPAGPVKIDRTCRTGADCTVKNVGNCCGQYPACVNVDSPTDPAGVQAECARTGRMSVCGFREIQGCQCVQGQCQDQAAPLGVQVQ